MKADTVRLRLSGHGDLSAHRDGTCTLRLTRPAGEFWSERLRRAVKDEVPGATIRVVRCRPAADRYFEHHEVVFSLSDAPGAPAFNGAQQAMPGRTIRATPSISPELVSAAVGASTGCGAPFSGAPKVVGRAGRAA